MSLYTPRHFQARNDEDALRVIREHPFATLVTAVDGSEPFITHIPLLLEENYLLGHMAKPNPQWQAFARGRTVAVFHGPHQYISPRWYDKPDENVPTWNYATVHVSGAPELLDEAAARRIIGCVTAHFENGRWTAQPEKVERLLGGIVAFRMPLARIEAKVKMNQNRTPADRVGVVGALNATGLPEDAAVADWIKRSND